MRQRHWHGEVVHAPCGWLPGVPSPEGRAVADRRLRGRVPAQSATGVAELPWFRGGQLRGSGLCVEESWTLPTRLPHSILVGRHRSRACARGTPAATWVFTRKTRTPLLSSALLRPLQQNPRDWHNTLPRRDPHGLPSAPGPVPRRRWIPWWDTPPGGLRIAAIVGRRAYKQMGRICPEQINAAHRRFAAPAPSGHPSAASF